MGMVQRVVATFACAFLFAVDPDHCAAQSIELRFPEEAYQVRVGDPLDLPVHLVPVPKSGIVSYGIKASLLPSTGVQAEIEVPSNLNFDGVNGPGARMAIAQDYAAVKGTVDLESPLTQTHTESLLTTFRLTFGAPGDYLVSLDLFNTLGPTEEIFVTGLGEVLDDSLEFDTVLVVVSEPGSFRRGDFDGNGVLDETDATAVLDLLWRNGTESVDCFGEALSDAADSNDNEWITVADYLAIRDAAGGPAKLPAPSPDCGVDPDDSLRGFDAVDAEFVISVGDAVIIPKSGAKNRDLQLPVVVRVPRGITGMTLILEYDSEALTPFDTSLGDTEFFTTSLGVSHTLVDSEAGKVVVGLWTEEPDQVLVSGDSEALQTVGTLSFHIADFAIVRQFRWAAETTHAGRAFRATLVDEEFVDHHPALSAGPTQFVRGNSNDDASVDISDSIFTLNYLFGGGPTPPCLDAADANNDSGVDISDPIYSLNFLFVGGPPIPAPHPTCGLDEGPIDFITCDKSAVCQ